jgi:hypothetical protein
MRWLSIQGPNFPRMSGLRWSVGGISTTYFVMDESEIVWGRGFSLGSGPNTTMTPQYSTRCFAQSDVRSDLNTGLWAIGINLGPDRSLVSLHGFHGRNL